MPPIISVPGPQVIGVGSLLTFSVTAVDPDGDDVTISGSSIPVNVLRLKRPSANAIDIRPGTRLRENSLPQLTMR